MTAESAEQAPPAPVEWRAYGTIGEYTSAEGPTHGYQAILGNSLGASMRVGPLLLMVEGRFLAFSSYPCVPKTWCGDWFEVSIGAGVAAPAGGVALSMGWLPYSGVVGAHAWWTPLGAPRGPVFGGLEAGYLLPLYQTPDRLAWSAYIGLRGEVRVSK